MFLCGAARETFVRETAAALAASRAAKVRRVILLCGNGSSSSFAGSPWAISPREAHSFRAISIAFYATTVQPRRQHCQASSLLDLPAKALRKRVDGRLRRTIRFTIFARYAITISLVAITNGP